MKAVVWRSMRLLQPAKPPPPQEDGPTKSSHVKKLRLELEKVSVPNATSAHAIVSCAQEPKHREFFNFFVAYVFDRVGSRIWSLA